MFACDVWNWFIILLLSSAYLQNDLQSFEVTKWILPRHSLIILIAPAVNPWSVSGWHFFRLHLTDDVVYCLFSCMSIYSSLFVVSKESSKDRKRSLFLCFSIESDFMLWLSRWWFLFSSRCQSCLLVMFVLFLQSLLTLMQLSLKHEIHSQWRFFRCSNTCISMKWPFIHSLSFDKTFMHKRQSYVIFDQRPGKENMPLQSIKQHSRTKAFWEKDRESHESNWINDEKERMNNTHLR